jgi:hypothetical protein
MNVDRRGGGGAVSSIIWAHFWSNFLDFLGIFSFFLSSFVKRVGGTLLQWLRLLRLLWRWNGSFPLVWVPSFERLVISKSISSFHLVAQALGHTTRKYYYLLVQLLLSSSSKLSSPPEFSLCSFEVSEAFKFCSANFLQALPKEVYPHPPLSFHCACLIFRKA